MVCVSKVRFTLRGGIGWLQQRFTLAACISHRRHRMVATASVRRTNYRNMKFSISVAEVLDFSMYWIYTCVPDGLCNKQKAQLRCFPNHRERQLPHIQQERKVSIGQSKLKYAVRVKWLTVLSWPPHTSQTQINVCKLSLCWMGHEL